MSGLNKKKLFAETDKSLPQKKAGIGGKKNLTEKNGKNIKKKKNVFNTDIKKLAKANDTKIEEHKKEYALDPKIKADDTKLKKQIKENEALIKEQQKENEIKLRKLAKEHDDKLKKLVKQERKIDNKIAIKTKKRDKQEYEEARLRSEAEAYLNKKSLSSRCAEKFGRVKIEVYGTGFSKLVNALSKNFRLEKVVLDDKKMTFLAYAKDRLKIIAMLDNLCYNYTIVKSIGVFPAAIMLFGRAGVILGLTVAVACVIVYPKIITKIEIEGTLNPASTSILRESGITVGNFLWNLEGDTVARKLQAVDGVAFASVKRNGAHVYVVIKEERDEIGFVDISGGVVKASKLASVTRVLVHGGTAEVKYGDIVKIGDTLIGDYVMVNDVKVTTPARGEVYGKQYHSLELYFPDTELIKTVGRVQTYTKTAMLGKMPKPPKSPFKCYQLETVKQPNNFLIPFEVYTFTYTEIITVEHNNIRTDDMMIRETGSRLLESLPPDSKILDVISNISRVDGGVKVKVIYETEERID